MQQSDVTILGGGLAGLTLALQLRREQPDLDIAVIERNAHPVDEAAHKVGESTVEIAARYFANDLGLGSYLDQNQLRKFGLRFFFGSGNHRDLAKADELGGSELLAVRSYQLDRGLFENDLGRMAKQAGIEFIDDARVRTVDLGEDTRHSVTYQNGAGERSIQSRWVVDASGRAGLLKRKMGWERSNAHNANGIWFRISREIRIDDWSDNGDWQNRATAMPRWNSTNHLMGPGYWVWLIPLASGATSFGIVADADMHPLEQFRTFDGCLDWLRRHEPRCAEAVAEHQDELMDYRFLRHYSHDSARVFSADRFALTGEAGVFLDPFYSPGSDFIAISNRMIGGLIQRDLNGDELRRPVAYSEQLYFSFFRTTLKLYQDQYPGWGDTRLMVLKTIWDYVYYWAVLAPLFYRRRMADLEFLESHQDELIGLQKLNIRVQDRFRQRADQRLAASGQGVFFDQCEMPLLVELNAALEQSHAEGDGAELTRNAAILHPVADELLAMLGGQPSDHGRVRGWFGDLEAQLNATGL